MNKNQKYKQNSLRVLQTKKLNKKKFKKCVWVLILQTKETKVDEKNCLRVLACNNQIKEKQC